MGFTEPRKLTMVKLECPQCTHKWSRNKEQMAECKAKPHLNICPIAKPSKHPQPHQGTPERQAPSSQRRPMQENPSQVCVPKPPRRGVLTNGSTASVINAKRRRGRSRRPRRAKMIPQPSTST